MEEIRLNIQRNEKTSYVVAVRGMRRKTNESDIRLKLILDGRGNSRISTSIGFFDHMRELFARHGAFNLPLTARGDLDVDQHHTVEDVSIALGEAVRTASCYICGFLELRPMPEPPRRLSLRREENRNHPPKLTVNTRP